MSFVKNKKYMQYQLLELALKEVGVTDANIEVDHVKGLNRVNGIILELKYPDSFLDHIKLLSQKKIYDYVFKGTTKVDAASLNRNELLEKFNHPKNKVISTSKGIKRKNKTEFDKEYYQLLANSRYSLCPNWGGIHWDHQYAWTYRFIEATFCKSIPIVFDETPLGTNNTKDIVHFSNNNLPTLKDKEHNDLVKQNYIKAIKHWTLQDSEVNLIKKNS